MFFVISIFFFKQKTAYDLRISDWSSDVCSSDLECVELALRMDAAAIGREPIPGERRSGGTRSTVIDDIGPEPRLRGAALAGHEHRHRRVVGVQLGGLQSFLADPADDGVAQVRGLDRPAGEGRAEEHKAAIQSLMRS